MIQMPEPRGNIFTWPVRVYWEDTDAGGVVYHAAYVRFLERARTEWLRALYIGQQELREQLGVQFVVHGMELRFSAPARLDDLLAVTVEPTDNRAASFTTLQQVRREPQGALLVQARVRIACVDARQWRPCAIPGEIAGFLEQSD